MRLGDWIQSPIPNISFKNLKFLSLIFNIINIIKYHKNKNGKRKQSQVEKASKVEERHSKTRKDSTKGLFSEKEVILNHI